MQQKGVAGNTILFAQPTAEIPSMELPPPSNALIDFVSVIFTRSTQCLSKAWWATVNRSEYMRIVRERKAECATYAHVVLREDEATTRLPEDGVPEQLQHCTQHVEGVHRAPVQMKGPASRAPELSTIEEAGEDSESDADDQDALPAEPSEDPTDSIAECTVAVDPMSDCAPVKLMQALQGTLHALQSQAASIIKNEKTPTIEDSDGVLQPVADEGGRHEMKSLVLDVQTVARAFDEKTQNELETIQAGADSRRKVCPNALAIPTLKALESWDARSWAACFVEFWFGDGAPNLERERSMLFEEVARRLLEIEELEYSLPTDTEPYEASCQSRFNTPEIACVLGDVVRRLRLLKGTRAAIGRKGFFR